MITFFTIDVTFAKDGKAFKIETIPTFIIPIVIVLAVFLAIRWLICKEGIFPTRNKLFGFRCKETFRHLDEDKI